MRVRCRVLLGRTPRRLPGYRRCRGQALRRALQISAHMRDVSMPPLSALRYIEAHCESATINSSRVSSRISRPYHVVSCGSVISIPPTYPPASPYSTARTPLPPRQAGRLSAGQRPYLRLTSSMSSRIAALIIATVIIPHAPISPLPIHTTHCRSLAHAHDCRGALSIQRRGLG